MMIDDDDNDDDNIYNFIHHQTMIGNSEKNKQLEIIKN